VFLTFKDSIMATRKEHMDNIKNKLTIIRAEIVRLQAQEEILVDLLGHEGGEPPPKAQRRRSPNIKPLVLDLMHKAGFTGATTAEVDYAVRQRVPSVAKDTVGSVLSRLKALGALTYNGERYYEKQFTPKEQPPFDAGLRVVS
jgi:hypothetical protein